MTEDDMTNIKLAINHRGDTVVFIEEVEVIVKNLILIKNRNGRPELTITLDCININ